MKMMNNVSIVESAVVFRKLWFGTIMGLLYHDNHLNIFIITAFIVIKCNWSNFFRTRK